MEAVKYSTKTLPLQALLVASKHPPQCNLNSISGGEKKNKPHHTLAELKKKPHKSLCQN